MYAHQAMIRYAIGLLHHGTSKDSFQLVNASLYFTASTR